MITAAVLVRRTTESSANPSRPGSITSSSTKSGPKEPMADSSSAPSESPRDSKPWADKAVCTGTRMASESSTSRIREADIRDILPRLRWLTPMLTLTSPA